MNRKLGWTLCGCLLLGAATQAAAAEQAASSADVKRLFAAPPREYASAPLWVWNDMLTEEQVRGTLRDLAGQKVRQAFVHPRPGLMTPYLGDEWFRLWKVALDEAEKLDMNIWIYDENSYPSGFAGGWVPEVMPESRGRGLKLHEEKRITKPGPEVVAVYRLTAGGFENVTDKARAGQPMPEDRYVVASVVRAENSPWHGDRSYVDLMYPGVTEKFLEVTLEAYKKHVGDQFGKRVLGAFTDEPNVNPAGGLPWTDHLPAEFQKRWGYSLLDHLPSLIRPVGRWKQVRHDYFQVVLEQYVEHWAKPYYDWCDKNGIAFTGHYWDHEWPNCIGVPDNMAMSAYQHIPGIDCLMNQYREDTHAQFGNVRMVKEVQSLCNQLGRKRYLCEIYGAGGWDLRFEDMKRIGDWLEVLGVNLLDEHLSYVTLRGARKADHPQSFSYHEPWWDSYHQIAGYFTRLTAAMCQGDQVNHVLVIEPTTTAWMYQADSTQKTHLDQIGKTFFDLLMSLERAQVEYDLGCEEVIARHGMIEDVEEPPYPSVDSRAGVWFAVGKRSYHTVVLPPMTETLSAKTVNRLEEFARGGRGIVSCGPPPDLVDGRPSDRVKKLSQKPGWLQVKPEDLAEKLVPVLGRDRTAIRRAAADKGILFHHRRKLADGELLLLVNTSIEAPTSGTIESQLKGAEAWDCRTGKAAAYPFASQAGAIQLSFRLPPCGSLLLFLSEKPLEPGPAAGGKTTTIPPSGALEARRLEPNVLTLDYLDVTAGGETRKGLYFHAANQMAFEKNGMKRNPWDSAVQFKEELISKKFPPQSGFEATYRFTIEGAVPKPLWIVIERPDLYAVACNGTPVKAAKDAWWLDRAFGKIDVSATARPGPNAVTIKAAPFTIYHEIEPAYVLGDFGLKATQSGFAIVPPGPIAMREGITHGAEIEKTMWLSTGIGYHRDPADPKANDRAPWVELDLGKSVDLGAIEVWNYNEVNLTRRGVKRMAVSTAAGEAADALKPLGTFELAEGGTAAQKLPVDAKGVRFVKFTILENHAGTTYPARDGGVDNAFAGLSEVRFFAAAAPSAPAAPLAGVKIRRVSSELAHAMHDRRAVHLVDSSGLGRGGLGWNQQGLPFYAAGVAYQQSFDVPQPSGRYRVVVPSWYGSVAKILVNGKLAGHLVSQPWECDVTECIQPGANAIQVVVIGTLKNTLGPHHAGANRGTAWPGMFHQGPRQGPPPGAAYDTIGYGLFAPFGLVQVTR